MKRVLKIVASAIVFAAIIAVLVGLADQSRHGRMEPESGSVPIADPN